MIGQTLAGRYQITRLLGNGGFGVTYLAKDIQLPQHPDCVVKQFKPIVSNSYTLEVGKKLFDREARTLEILGKQHDQIPRLLAHFEENKEFYLVQDFIPGHDLTDELIPGERKDESYVLKFLEEILEILAFVHQQNTVHRDIKPSNIRRRKDGKLVLIDFGAVKQVTTQTIHTQHLQNPVHMHGPTVIGNPGYMPVEQEVGEPYYSSDIYAVGVVCIQALTGIHPDPRVAKGLPKDSHTREIIWRNSVKINPKLADIIDKMVRYDHRQRYQNATEALQAVKKLHQKSIPLKLWLGIGITSALASLMFLFYYMTKPQLNLAPYDNSNNGIKIKYPQNWVKQEQGGFTGEVASFFPQIPTKPNACPLEVAVNVNDLPQKLLSLNEYKDLAISKIKNSSNTQITDESSPTTTLSSFNAYKLAYTRNDGQCQLQVMEIGTVRNGKAYFITYTAELSQYSQFKPIAEAMVNSFQIQAAKTN